MTSSPGFSGPEGPFTSSALEDRLTVGGMKDSRPEVLLQSLDTAYLHPTFPMPFQVASAFKIGQGRVRSFRSSLRPGPETLADSASYAQQASLNGPLQDRWQMSSVSLSPDTFW